MGRRMAGGSWQVEVMQGVPELRVHDRMSQVEKTMCARGKKKKVRGVWRKKLRLKCWTSTRLSTAKEKLSKAEALSWERRRDEAAAKNEDYEKSEKENQVKRKNGR